MIEYIFDNSQGTIQNNFEICGNCALLISVCKYEIVFHICTQQGFSVLLC